MKKLFLITFALTIFFTLPNSSYAFKAKDFFPLVTGSIRTYETKREIVKDGATTNFAFYDRMYTQEKKKINGEKVFPFERKCSETEDGEQELISTYYLLIEKDGIAVFGRAVEGDKEKPQPTIYERPRYILKDPLEVGKSWGNMYGSIKEIRKVIAVNEAIMTPYSVFENCVGIESNILNDNGMKVRGIAWYCPNIGRVKSTAIVYQDVEIFWKEKTENILKKYSAK